MYETKLSRSLLFSFSLFALAEKHWGQQRKRDEEIKRERESLVPYRVSESRPDPPSAQRIWLAPLCVQQPKPSMSGESRSKNAALHHRIRPFRSRRGASRNKCTRVFSCQNLLLCIIAVSPISEWVSPCAALVFYA